MSETNQHKYKTQLMAIREAETRKNKYDVGTVVQLTSVVTAPSCLTPYKNLIIPYGKGTMAEIISCAYEVSHILTLPPRVVYTIKIIDNIIKVSEQCLEPARFPMNLGDRVKLRHATYTWGTHLVKEDIEGTIIELHQSNLCTVQFDTGQVYNIDYLELYKL